MKKVKKKWNTKWNKSEKKENTKWIQSRKSEKMWAPKPSKVEKVKKKWHKSEPTTVRSSELEKLGRPADYQQPLPATILQIYLALAIAFSPSQ